MIPAKATFAFLALLTPAAQTTPPGAPASPSIAANDAASAQPLPDINTLMRQAEQNQRTFEAVQKNYIYTETSVVHRTDAQGKVKKTEDEEREIFWIEGVPVSRVLKRDGKELTPDEKKKEDQNIDKRVAEAKARRAKADDKGKQTDPAGHDEVSFARILELGAFSNERRELRDGRPTIVVDYTGDPKAKTHNPAEGAFRELAGTVWIDEHDCALVHLQGAFRQDFKLGGGLLVDLHKGTSFQISLRKINGEVWLLDSLQGQGSVRAMLLINLRGDLVMHAGNYRKFKATSTILPGLTQLPPELPNSSPEPTPPPATPPPPASPPPLAR